MAEADAATQALYSSLHAALSADEPDWEEGLDVSARILNCSESKPTGTAAEPAAARARVACLLQLGDCAEALELLDAKLLRGEEGLGFERAFALFSVGRMGEALDTLRAAGLDSAGAAHLEAQVHYRLGSYGEVVSAYTALRKGGEDSADFCANVLAAYAQSGECAAGLALLPQLEAYAQSYEGVYNSACVMIGDGQLDKAAAALAAAEKVCREAGELDDWEEDEIDEATHVIQSQMGYVMQLEGNATGAMEAYAAVTSAGNADRVVEAVTRNNIAVLRGRSDLFDVFKRLRASRSEAVVKRMSDVQKRALGFNFALCLLLMGKRAECEQELTALHSQYGDCEQHVVLKASFLMQQKKHEQGAKLLQQFIAQHPNDCQRVQLALGECELEQHNVKSAVRVLQSVMGADYSPGMVVTLVGLLDTSGQQTEAVALLDAATAHWEAKADASPLSREQSWSADGGESDKARLSLRGLLRFDASYKLKRGLHDSALQSFERVIALYPHDHEAIAMAITAAARCDPAAAKQYESMLPRLEEADGLDGEELERKTAPSRYDKQRKRADVPAGGLGQGGGAMEMRESAQAGEDGDEGAEGGAQKPAKEKKKKKKKSRFPKDYDPEHPEKNPVDPERWLPKRERSGFKKRKAKRGANKNQARGPQGGTSGSTWDDRDAKNASKEALAAAKLDVNAQNQAKAAAAEAAAKSAPPVDAAAARQKQQQQQKKKKKKKKGRR